MLRLSPPFHEADWLAAQAGRSARLKAYVIAWVENRAIGSVLGEQLRHRLASIEPAAGAASPGTFAMAMADSLGASPEDILKVGLAAHVFWAAADVADDIDDHAPDAPSANLACALLFLAQQAMHEVSPRMVLEGARYGLRMAAGQALDLAHTDRPTPPEMEAIIANKAGAELEFFMLLALETTGRTAPELLTLACEFGKSLQVLSDIIDVYVKPQSDDFAAGKWTPVLAAYWSDLGHGGAVLKALDRRDPAVLAYLRYAISPSARDALRGIDERLAFAWEQAACHLPNPAPFGTAIAWACMALQTLREALEELAPAPLPPIVEPQSARLRAVAYLEHGHFGEEHRWGFLGAPYVFGGLFTAIFQAASLRAANADWRPVFDAILAMRDVDGWRYYPHRNEIAPDADDAGLILGYFGDVLPAPIKDFTTRQLSQGFRGDGIATWLGSAHGDVEWTGDDCLATLANASWGLMRVGCGLDVPYPALQRIERALLTNELASPFYEPHAVRFFAHRVMAQAARNGLITARSAGALRDLLQSQLDAEQHQAGNFGDRLVVNATCILAAAQWGIQLKPELAYWLAARQAENGAWPSEPVFMGPGVNMRPQRWGHEGLTTAWVLLSLLA